MLLVLLIHVRLGKAYMHALALFNLLVSCMCSVAAPFLPFGMEGSSL